MYGNILLICVDPHDLELIGGAILLLGDLRAYCNLLYNYLMQRKGQYAKSGDDPDVVQSYMAPGMKSDNR